MTIILGISAYYHDSAAAIIKNGEIIAAAQEERFTRIKHDSAFPKNAINYCLKEAQIKPEQLDGVVFYEKPLIKFERILETVIAFAPKSLKLFIDSMPIWLNTKLFIPKEIDKFFNNELKCPIYFTSHHESHQASAFYPSPFDDAVILCLDGVGEWDTTSWGIGNKNRLEIKQVIEFPHSLGLLYSAFTSYLGFKVNSGEYKVMGLAPYGEPIYKDLILKNITDVKQDGSFWLNQKYFSYGYKDRMYSPKLIELFQLPPRIPETEITQKHMDIAESIQSVTNEIILKLAKGIKKKSGMKNLCLAGGCALNCVANGILLKEKIFDNIWIQPASGDAGGALGAAMCIYYNVLNNHRKTNSKSTQKYSLLGISYKNEQIKEILDKYNAQYEIYEESSAVERIIAEELNNGKIIGHFAGRMEYGPRALGNRSILADARDTNMQKRLNLAIKKREAFRPFAPSCLEEDAQYYFNLDGNTSPYMLLTTEVSDNIKITTDKNITGLKQLDYAHSTIPAVTHVDYSARIQTVSKDSNPRFYNIINEFKKLTGCCVVVNTSFNIRGEPIVCSPEDAYRCFMHTDMDMLVIENFVLYKNKQQEIHIDDYYTISD
ncbi:carbamoyltransferase [bacterium]|nr:carbamoyltransferase [bacterium]